MELQMIRMPSPNVRSRSTWALLLLALLLTLPTAGCGSSAAPLAPLTAGTHRADSTLDVRGKAITTFIVHRTTMRLDAMPTGGLLEVVTDATDGIRPDLEAWCRMTGHQLESVVPSPTELRFYIRKAPPDAHAAQRRAEAKRLPATDQRKTVAMVISNPGLEELLSPLGFALAAALSGMDVYLYFQGPAVRALEEGFEEELGGFNSLFSGFAREQLAAIGHIRAQAKLRQLHQLGATFFVCGPSMSHFGVAKEDLIFDDAIVAEYLTFIERMASADMQVFLQ
jgi:predicted peroxiredoxin/TusA-related sulfurtransferase